MSPTPGIRDQQKEPLLNTPVQESNLPLIIISCRRFSEGVVDSEGAARLLHPHPLFSTLPPFSHSTFVRSFVRPPLPVFLSRWQIMPLRGSIMTERVEINQSKHGKVGERARTRRSLSVSARTMPPSCATGAGPIVGAICRAAAISAFQGRAFIELCLHPPLFPPPSPPCIYNSRLDTYLRSKEQKERQ